MGLILVVDDEPDVLDLLTRLVRGGSNHTTESASSPEEAIRVAAARPPGLVVTDFQMPGMNGIELARTLKARVPGLKVLLITAFADSSLGASALKEGLIDAHCRKSDPPREILGLVKRLLL